MTELKSNYVTLWDELFSYVHAINTTVSTAFEVAKPYIIFDVDSDVTEKQASIEISARSRLNDKVEYCFSLFYDVKIYEATDKSI